MNSDFMATLSSTHTRNMVCHFGWDISKHSIEHNKQRCVIERSIRIPAKGFQCFWIAKHWNWTGKKSTESDDSYSVCARVYTNHSYNTMTPKFSGPKVLRNIALCVYVVWLRLWLVFIAFSASILQTHLCLFCAYDQWICFQWLVLTKLSWKLDCIESNDEIQLQVCVRVRVLCCMLATVSKSNVIEYVKMCCIVCTAHMGKILFLAHWRPYIWWVFLCLVWHWLGLPLLLLLLSSSKVQKKRIYSNRRSEHIELMRIIMNIKA